MGATATTFGEENMKTILALAAAAVLIAGPANAQSQTETLTTTVRYGDLNLGQAPGRAKLDSRIRMAISAVCPASSPQPLREARSVRQCRAAALAALQPELAKLNVAPSVTPQAVAASARAAN